MAGTLGEETTDTSREAGATNKRAIWEDIPSAGESFDTCCASETADSLSAPVEELWRDLMRLS